jgi:hypothetical protein
MRIIIFFYYNRMKYNLILFIFIFIIIIVFLYFYYYKYEKFKNYTIKEANNMFLKNKNKVYKLNIIKKEEDMDKCYQKCNPSDCMKLDLMKNNYDKCNKCQNNKNNCFNNLSSTGICDPCGKNLKKFNCNDINKFACPKIHDVFNKTGTKPYYLEVINKNDITSPYNQSCLFCWNIKNYL